MNNQHQKRGRRHNNNNNNHNGGRRGGNPGRQNFDSNGPGVRIRGNATQINEKYLQMARDAQGSGDRVLAENMLQHAEHYYRIANVDTGERPNRSARPPEQNASAPANGQDRAEQPALKPVDADQAAQSPSADSAVDKAGEGEAKPERAPRARGRGRPRKIEAKERPVESSPREASSTQAPLKTDHASTTPPPMAPNAEAETEEVAPPKRGRGRPRKTPVTEDGKVPAPRRRPRKAPVSDDADDAGVRAIIGVE